MPYSQAYALGFVSNLMRRRSQDMADVARLLFDVSVGGLPGDRH